jgi:hypothetical protein
MIDPEVISKVLEPGVEPATRLGGCSLSEGGDKDDLGEAELMTISEK